MTTQALSGCALPGRWLMVALLAGLVGVAGCSSGGGTSASASISVSIANKITTIHAAAAAVTFTASVQNDSSNSGVMWTLTSGGSACSPQCGTLSGISSSSATYTPPSAPPAVPQNTPTLAATSVKDPTKSDLDGFTITAALPVSVTIANKITTIQAGTAAVTLTAQVQNDASNSGVTWTLAAAGAACSPDCGALSGVTTTSATYTPPNAAPQSPTNQPVITATSVRDNTQSDTDQFTITASSVAVTITDKVNAVTAGSSSITLMARVTNDPSNSGVAWTLTGNGGTNCTPDCGTLGARTATSVVYNPPATAQAFPGNLVSIAANSVRDGTKGDLDSLTVISGNVSSCSGTPTGHESLLSGQYAFFAQGVSVMAGSFSADGSGHFTDLGNQVAGSLDINTEGNPQSITLAGSDAGSGFYTVGTDPAGAGDIGCLSLYGSDGNTRVFRFSLGRVNGGVAEAGRITEYDDQTGNAVGATSRVSGPLLRQDPSAFSSGDTSHLQANYAFGLTGALGYQATVAGALVVNPSSGTITNSDFDSYEMGVTSAVVQSDVQGSTGSIASVSPLTGRALFSFTPNGSNFWPGGNTQTQAAIYIVNANEFFLVSLDLPTFAVPFGAPAWLYTGRAISTGTTFNLSSLSGNYIFHATGFAEVNGASSPQVDLGLLYFNNGSVAGTIYGYGPGAGTSMASMKAVVYTVNSSFGRAVLTGTGLPNPLVSYLATPGNNTESIKGFVTGTSTSGTTSAFGLLEPGATTNLSTNSMAGNYFFGDESLVSDGTAVNRAGVVSIDATGALNGTQLGSTIAPDLLTETTVSRTFTITGGFGLGTGNAGANSVAVTNGSKLFLLDESAGAPATITVVEPR